MSLSAMVLAAGLGTRLRPLTDELPKPLCPVGGRAPASVIVERLAAAGASGVVVNTHHLASAWEGWASSQVVPITVVREPGDTPLGTAGGIAHARRALGDGDVVIWNGDVIADVDVPALVEAHRTRGAFATLAVRPRSPGEGPVGLGIGGAITRLRAARAGDELSGADYTGIAVLSAACVAALPARGCLVGDAWIPHLLARGPGALLAWQHAGGFRDVGSLGEYLDANLDAVRSRGRVALVAADVEVPAGIALDEVVVGAGARLSGEGALQRVVVWPGAHAVAPLRDAVVTPRGVVVVPRRG